MATPAFSQDSGPLIDLLLKKGIVTDQEAEDLRAELVKDFAVNSPAGKLDLSSRVTRFALTGDVRVRYQYDNEIANNFAAAPATGPANDRSRYRYRIRLAPTVSLNNNWTVGMRFETAPGSTSTNDDFGAPGSHNFAKDGNTAFIGQAYLQYAKTSVFGGAIDAIDVRLGKHAHPFAAFGVNGFWIDTDINFEGLSEELRWTDVIAPGWTLAARAGQYLLANNSRTANRTGGFINHPSTLWIGQLEFAKTYLYENNPYGLRITPTVVAFTGPEVTGTTLNQADSATTTNYDNLLIAMLGFEYTVKANNLPLGIYGTYGYNLQGGQRANWLYSSSATAQVLNTAAGNPSNY
ncbi:MAG TPA: putative porin, partial [Opitutus sp.]|nr:putative porin [Opitutus sp.]